MKAETKKIHPMKNTTLVLFLIFSIFIMAEQKQVTISDGVEGDTGQQGSRRIGLGVKAEWPEVVGLAAEEAEAKIKEDAPGLNIQVVPPGYFVTMDYNTGRVRIFTDATGKVKKAPTVG